jgi:energy-coupling factor transport system substrate-specific component
MVSSLSEFLHNHYYIASLVILVLAMVPFAVSFEGRRPQARELVVIAVMVAITVCGRAAFFMVPQFKPVVALVIIAGAALGPQSGFICGALSGFVSNFIFGQGPWTPWQMFGFGLIGCLAGLVFGRLSASAGAPVDCGSGAAMTDVEKTVMPDDAGGPRRGVRARKRAEHLRVLALCAFGFVVTFALYGLLLDTAAIATFSSEISRASLVATYLAGIPFNLVHALSTVIFLAILARPMIGKLERVKRKYGLLVTRDRMDARARRAGSGAAVDSRAGAAQ